MNKSLKVIVGLGNPGSEYKNTRHNIGFEILDELINFLSSNFSEAQVSEQNAKKLRSKIISIKFFNKFSSELVLVYPQTFMNLSGEALRAVLNWYKIPQSGFNKNKLLIVHDDVSLPLGKFRWVSSGGAGGQHGIESVISHLGTKDFPRLKFGIGPDPGGEKRAQFVLSKFSSEEILLLKKTIKLAVESICEYILEEIQIDKIQAKFNGLV